MRFLRLTMLAFLLLAIGLVVSCSKQDHGTMKNMVLKPGYNDAVDLKSPVAGNPQKPREPKGPEPPPVR